MTNHGHLILSSDGSNKQADIIRDFKIFTSKDVLNSLKATALKVAKIACLPISMEPKQR
jgi:hypothetical protein